MPASFARWVFLLPKKNKTVAKVELIRCHERQTAVLFLGVCSFVSNSESKMHVSHCFVAAVNWHLAFWKCQVAKVTFFSLVETVVWVTYIQDCSNLQIKLKVKNRLQPGESHLVTQTSFHGLFHY